MQPIRLDYALTVLYKKYKNWRKCPLLISVAICFEAPVKYADRYDKSILSLSSIPFRA